MDRWPAVDVELRRKLFADMRSRQRRAAAQLTAADRIARLVSMVDFAAVAGSARPASAHSTDEQAGLLRWARRGAARRMVGADPRFLFSELGTP